jgi:hypothetical protein
MKIPRIPTIPRYYLCVCNILYYIIYSRHTHIDIHGIVGIVGIVEAKLG